MTKAVVLKEKPPLPTGAITWARSSRRASMYHAVDVFGISMCRQIKLERHRCHENPELHDMQYWGVCPRCYRKAVAA